MPPLRDFAREQLALAAERSLARRVVETERLGGTRVRAGAGNSSRSVAAITWA